MSSLMRIEYAADWQIMLGDDDVSAKQTLKARLQTAKERGQLHDYKIRYMSKGMWDLYYAMFTFSVIIDKDDDWESPEEIKQYVLALINEVVGDTDVDIRFFCTDEENVA